MGSMLLAPSERLADTALDILPLGVWEQVFSHLPQLDMAGLHGASVLSRQNATLASVSRDFNVMVQSCWDRLAEDVQEMIAACNIKDFVHQRAHVPAWHNFYERMQLQEFQMAHLDGDFWCSETRRCPGLPPLGTIFDWPRDPCQDIV